MFMEYFVFAFLALLSFQTTDAGAWVSYVPVTFVGDISAIYSKMPAFHGYTQEFLNDPQARQICQDASNDGVKLDYCSRITSG